MDVNKLCLNCMHEKETENERCPHCGFLKDEYEILPHHLPFYTVLHGNYLVGKVIGEGGFGITYIGWDMNLNIKVAIKEFYPDGFVGRDGTQSATVYSYQGDKTIFFKEGKDKFLEEARRLGKFVNSAGIVSVKDFFMENNTVYIVMEYIEGISLKEYARQHGGKVEKNQLLEFMRPVLETLIEVHKTGLIHRDISPDNIMICNDNQVKLIDFGAARESSPEGEKSLSIMLKRGYSPEEQYRSRGEQGSWTDVYSLAATIYAMLTGIKPDEPLDRLEHETLIPPSKLGIDLTKRQEDVLLKAMAVKAADRVQTVEELLSGLYLDGKQNEFEMKKRKKLHSAKLGFAVAVLGILVFLCIGAYFILPGKSSEVIIYEAQVNEDIQSENMKEYLPEEATDISFQQGDALSNHMIIQSAAADGENYKLELQYQKSGRRIVQPIEISVKEPEIILKQEMLQTELGHKLENISDYYELKNADYLKAKVLDSTDPSQTGMQNIEIQLVKDDYIVKSVSMPVEYFDLNMEKEKLFELMKDYSKGNIRKDEKLEQYAEDFMEEAVSIEMDREWNDVLNSCSEKVIEKHSKGNYEGMIAIPLYGSDTVIPFKAEGFYQMLIENKDFSNLILEMEEIGISVDVVLDGKKSGVYWCIYYR